MSTRPSFTRSTMRRTLPKSARAKDDRYPDGRVFIGVGVQPHVLVPVTVADVQRGRDAALERAVDLLRGAPVRGRAARGRPGR